MIEGKVIHHKLYLLYKCPNDRNHITRMAEHNFPVIQYDPEIDQYFVYTTCTDCGKEHKVYLGENDE